MYGIIGIGIRICSMHFLGKSDKEEERKFYLSAPCLHAAMYGCMYV